MRKRWFASEFYLMSDTDKDYRILHKIEELLDLLNVPSWYGLSAFPTHEKVIKNIMKEKKGAKRFDTKIIGERTITTVTVPDGNKYKFHLEGSDDKYLKPLKKIVKKKGAKRTDKVVDGVLITTVDVPRKGSNTKYIFHSPENAVDEQSLAVEVHLNAPINAALDDTTQDNTTEQEIVS